MILAHIKLDPFAVRLRSNHVDARPGVGSEGLLVEAVLKIGLTNKEACWRHGKDADLQTETALGSSDVVAQNSRMDPQGQVVLVKTRPQGRCSN